MHKTQPGQARPPAKWSMADGPEPKIFATPRHKGYIYYSFFVPWCLSGRMEKVLPQKANNLLPRN